MLLSRWRGAMRIPAACPSRKKLTQRRGRASAIRVSRGYLAMILKALVWRMPTVWRTSLQLLLYGTVVRLSSKICGGKSFQSLVILSRSTRPVDETAPSGQEAGYGGGHQAERGNGGVGGAGKFPGDGFADDREG